MDIQQVHWELEMDYCGHPYYVSGNAIAHALGRRLAPAQRQHLHASHGLFVPGQFGTFPDAHSQRGSQPYLGTSLPPVERYADLFLFRDPAQRWLLDSRARDALNTHDVRVQSGHPALAHETIMGRPAAARKRQQTTRWYVSAYLHADEPALLPFDDEVLDGLQIGGKRSYGYGMMRLADTQLVDLETLDYPDFEAAEAVVIHLVTPFVCASEYPGTQPTDVPWWWAADRGDLRTRTEQMYLGGEAYRLETIDHCQTTHYTGHAPLETAKNGVTRIGSHAKYGFGELRVVPLTAAAVHQPPSAVTRGSPTLPPQFHLGGPDHSIKNSDYL